MPKFIIQKCLNLEIEVEAATPREAYEKEFELNDLTFTVSEYEYMMFDEIYNQLEFEPS